MDDDKKDTFYEKCSRGNSTDLHDLCQLVILIESKYLPLGFDGYNAADAQELALKRLQEKEQWFKNSFNRSSAPMKIGIAVIIAYMCAHILFFWAGLVYLLFFVIAAYGRSQSLTEAEEIFKGKLSSS